MNRMPEIICMYGPTFVISVQKRTKEIQILLPKLLGSAITLNFNTADMTGSQSQQKQLERLRT